MITLFRKNGIIIEKDETKKTYVDKIEVSYESVGYVKPVKKTVLTSEMKSVIKVSPLGFWYVGKEGSKELLEPQKEEGTARYLVTILTPKSQYNLEYLYFRDGVKVSEDTRPWDLEKAPMEDHFIDDLFKVLEDIFLEGTMKKGTEKADLYKSIFGHPKGPLKQTNEGKILSHGFDLKTSFRRRKEE